VARLFWSSPSQSREIVPADRLTAVDARDNDADGTPNSQDPDDDNDGTPDLQDADQDGDGFPNVDELAAGTDPQDSASRPAPAAAAGGGDDGGDRCGATGAEFLILLGLLGIFRRRQG